MALNVAIETVKGILIFTLEAKKVLSAKFDSQDAVTHLPSPLHKAVANVEFVKNFLRAEETGLDEYLLRTGKSIQLLHIKLKDHFFTITLKPDENQIILVMSSDQYFFKKNSWVCSDEYLQKLWDHGFAHEPIEAFAKLTRVQIIEKILAALQSNRQDEEE